MGYVSSRPVIAVYGEAAFRVANDRGSGLGRYEAVCLPPAGDEDRASVFAAFPAGLRGRPVVVWPGPGADGLALAALDAAVLADGIASAVGVAVAPDTDFVLGETPVDEGTAAAIAHAADLALADALARALPGHVCLGGLAVAPWPHALDASAMFEAVRALLARYLAEAPATLDAIVLWCLHAWAAQVAWVPASNVSPRLILQANDARADHARALRLIAWLTPRPRIVSRAIASHLLPAIEAECPTLLFDDVAGAVLYRREMRALIAAGATRDSTFLVGTGVKRAGAASAIEPWAACFAPAAVATASRVPDDMRLRAIVVPMSPVAAGQTRVRLAPGSPPDEVAGLRAQMSAFAAGLRDQTAEEDARAEAGADAALPRGLSATARENWHPLVAVAASIGGQVLSDALDAMRALAEAEPAPASNLALLGDIRALVPLGGNGVASAQVIERLVADAERPWASIRRGGKIDPRELAERLRMFGLRPATLRMEEDRFVRGYRAEDLSAAFERYLGADAITCDGNVTAA
ncbi:MAG: DUF3631 domain-containing protein [Alphaproteobacteria bacterium]|nr:DUF3631 domain-containing protein [Alphaproteobacteria bacterium]